MRKQLIYFLMLLSLLIFYTTSKIQQTIETSFLNSFLIIMPVFILMFGNLFISRARPPISEKTWYRAVSVFGTFLMGVWGTYILFSILLDLIRILVFGAYSISNTEGQYFEKLVNIFETANYYKLHLALTMAILGFFEVLRGPVVKKVSIHNNKITDDLDQIKIAQISDLHIGVSIRTSYVSKVIERTNKLDADIIVLTGDIIDADVQTIQRQIKLLSELKAKHGIFYITGNHEYYSGIESIINSLKDLGMQILLNENKTLMIKGSKLMIAGITDPAAHGIHPQHTPDIEKTARSAQPADYKILLAHQPNIYKKAVEYKFDLQLSGHTHGGQFFPFNLVVPLVHKYYRGLEKHENMDIYVNPGTGYWGPMNRFGIPAEITLLTLNKPMAE